MFTKKIYCFTVWVLFCICVMTLVHASRTAQASQFKVMVVMSYDDTYPWVKEIKEGIDTVLAGACELRYFYLDTKRNPAGGEQKVKEAFALYQEFQPDGVITADDNAQSMFAVPYLKDKVKTPVMFCGVNDDAEKYGFPASNVSGIIERQHVRESIAFIQQLVPSVKSVGFIQREDSSAQAFKKQIQGESESYPVKAGEYRMPKTLAEAVAITEEFKKMYDVLFIETMHGITDEKGKSLTDKEIMPIVTKIFGKPTLGANLYHVKQGILCAVIKTGQEQGETAANMLLKAMQGTPVSQIPVVKNQYGKRVLNADVMKELGLKPQPMALRGTEIVKTEK